MVLLPNRSRRPVLVVTGFAPDVLVVGGGPSGTMAALQLAALGHTVALVDAGTLHASGPFESVLASARPWLDKLGLGPVLGDAAEVDPLRHGAIWGAPELVWREDPSPGLLLRRGPFDRRLRALAAERGVAVFERSRVERTADGSLSVLDANGQVHGPFRPRCEVHATGRTSRGGARSHRTDLVAAPEGPRTLAFACIGEPHAADRGTAVVEAVRDGWIWTYAPSTGPACATVLLDRDELAAIGRSRLLARSFADANGPAGRLGSVRITNATEATATTRAFDPDGARLWIGDAAATIDPLASQGVEKAIAAGDHAAAVVHTALREPRWQKRLFACHHRFEIGVQAAHQRTAGEWYRREERFAEAPFWSRRRPGVPAASEPLPSGVLQVAPHVHAGPVLVRAGAEFVVADGAIDTRTGDETARIGYVPVPALLARFPTPTTLDAAVADGRNDPRLFVLPPRAVHAAMLELLRRGWLTPAGGAAGTR